MVFILFKNSIHIKRGEVKIIFNFNFIIFALYKIYPFAYFST